MPGPTHDEPSAVASLDVAPELAALASEATEAATDRVAGDPVPDGDEAA